MKKLIVLFLALSLLLGLAACGSRQPDDPNCGSYVGVSATMFGIEMEIHELFEKGFDVVLGSGGKGSITVDGTKAGLIWTLNGSSIHIEGTGQAGKDLVLDGTVDSGVMVLEHVLDSDMSVRLECPELMEKKDLGDLAASEPAPAAETPEPTTEPGPEPTPEPAKESYDWWAGKWYGWAVYYQAFGRYADLEDTAWDVVAEIEVDGTEGTLVAWDISDLNEADLSVRVRFAPGESEHGQMICQSGSFIDQVFARSAWVCDPGLCPESALDHMIVFGFTYYDAENSDNRIDVRYVLRPWGMLWDDVLQADTSEMLYENMMPLEYESWYLPQLEGTAEPPAQEEGDISSADSGEISSADSGVLVGSWAHSSGYTYTFLADGTGSYGLGDASMDFTYEVDGDQLSILYVGSTSPFVTTFRIEDNTLIILDSFGNEIPYPAV